MKKTIYFIFLVCFSLPLCFAQQKKAPEKKVSVKKAPEKKIPEKKVPEKKLPEKKPPEKKVSERKTPEKKTLEKSDAPKVVQTLPTLTEISETDWKNLTTTLKAENWDESARLAEQYLEKLKTDNEKSQLAQLRYFYLYSLAGKILKFSAAKNTLEENDAWQKLDEAVEKFNSKKFVLPPRQFLPECKEVLNYICAVKDNDRALRVTATNRAGTEIHSFDYILFDEKFSFNKSNASPETKIFMGGTLRTVQFNQDLSKRWVMRLIFENGFVTTAPDGK